MMCTVGDSHRDTLYCYLYVNNFFVHLEIRYADFTAKPPVKHFNFLSRIYLQGSILMGESSNVT